MRVILAMLNIHDVMPVKWSGPVQPSEALTAEALCRSGSGIGKRGNEVLRVEWVAEESLETKKYVLVKYCVYHETYE